MFDVRVILDFPFVYRLLQNLVRNKKHTKEYIDKYIKPREGDFILDIGCGPADILDFLPQVKYYGFDLNCRYIKAAQKKYGDRGSFFCQELTNTNIPDDVFFDVVLANKVLHHLDDEEAVKLFKLAEKCLKPGGRLITCDGCHTENEEFISKILLSWDRGKHVRNKEGYLNLARKVFNGVEYSIRKDLSNIPGSQIIICCTKL